MKGGGVLTGRKTPGLIALRERPLKRSKEPDRRDRLVITARCLTHEDFAGSVTAPASTDRFRET